MGRHLYVRGYQSSSDQAETRAFWASFFNNDLKPLIERKTGMSEKDVAANGKMLSGE